MHSKPLALSVVIPCFNESESIESLLREWSSCLNETVGDYEIIVVNDGSKDGTGRLLDKARREIKGLRVIHQLNCGYIGALRRGLESARGKYLLQLNADGRNDTEDFLRLWEKAEGSAMVLGARTHRIDPVTHRLASRLLKKLVRWTFKLDLEDADVPFRILRRDLAITYLSRLGKHKETLNVLLACWAKQDYPERVVQVAIPHRLPKKRRESGSLFMRIALGIHFAKELYLASRTQSLLAPNLDSLGSAGFNAV